MPKASNKFTAKSACKLLIESQYASPNLGASPVSRLTRTANSAMMASLISHLLCCGLPTIINLLALISGLGTFSAMAPWIGLLHDNLHKFEEVLLLVSALTLGFGFWANRVSSQRNCVTETCHHEPCAPKKQQSRIILIIASILFGINMGAYIWHQFS